MLRAGHAGSGTAADHLAVLDAALAQLPVDPGQREVICRTDAGGTSHQLAAACRARRVRFVGGMQLHAQLAEVILTLHRSRWQPTISADGSEVRQTGEVAEITDLVDVSGWPAATRMLVRREQPHPGAQLSFTDVEGYRYQVFITDLPDARPGLPGGASYSFPSYSVVLARQWVAEYAQEGCLPKQGESFEQHQRNVDGQRDEVGRGAAVGGYEHVVGDDDDR